MLHLSTSKIRLADKGKITLHLRIADLHTAVLFKVECLSIHMPVGKTFINENILGIVPDKQKVTVQRPTIVPNLKQHIMSANPSITEKQAESKHKESFCGKR